MPGGLHPGVRRSAPWTPYAEHYSSPLQSNIFINIYKFSVILFLFIKVLSVRFVKYLYYAEMNEIRQLFQPWGWR